MDKGDLTKSPLLHVRQMLPHVSTFTFKVYKTIKPDEGDTYSRTQEKVYKYISVPRAEATADWLRSTLLELPQGADLVLTSKVLTDGGDTAHIPMADCSGRFDLLDFANAMKADRSELQSYFGYRPLMVSSGRSYHMYGERLLTEKQWQESLGELLLLNNDETKFIDDRWVGRRLVSGHSGLRLSCNNERYLQMPTVLGRLNLMAAKPLTW